ncbi:MAG: YgiQ family radical SAM protein, partial [Bacteroidales bacterium]
MSLSPNQAPTPKNRLPLSSWLPITRKEMEDRGWDQADIILLSGDAYVDHPCFGTAVIGRTLEAKGYKVAILSQPNWRDDLRDFKKLGAPRLFFGVSAGCMDSMVNHYTARKRLRSDDAYTPGGLAGFRPDYPTIVYTKILKQLFPEIPVMIGGIEASLRRVTHYDYWQDQLRPSFLVESGADLLVYGMGEKPVVDIARSLDRTGR